MFKHTEIIKYADTNISSNTQVLKAEFYINENKRTVVCKLTDEVLFFEAEYSGTTYTYIQKYIKNGFFEGIAKCCPEDTFITKIGKKVALEKALHKRNIVITQLTKEIEDNFKKQLDIPANHMLYKISKV